MKGWWMGQRLWNLTSSSTMRSIQKGKNRLRIKTANYFFSCDQVKYSKNQYLRRPRSLEGLTNFLKEEKSFIGPDVVSVSQCQL